MSETPKLGLCIVTLKSGRALYFRCAKVKTETSSNKLISIITSETTGETFLYIDLADVSAVTWEPPK